MDISIFILKNKKHDERIICWPQVTIKREVGVVGGAYLHITAINWQHLLGGLVATCKRRDWCLFFTVTEVNIVVVIIEGFFSRLAANFDGIWKSYWS